MAATAWEFFNAFKSALGRGLVDLSGSTTTFRMILLGSASPVESRINTWSSYSSVTGELPTDNGYTAGGKTITVNWSVKTTTSTFSFSFATVTFTAGASSSLPDIKYALIMTQTSSLLVMYTRLTTAAVTLSPAQEYNIYPNPVAFELN